MRSYALGLVAASIAAPALAASPPIWSGFAANAQHTAPAPVAGHPLRKILWHTPVDLDPQYSGNALLIHYASPMIAGSGLLLVPVKTTATGGFELTALDTKTGSQKWALASDYVVPPATWTPPFPAAISPSNNAFIAAAGATILRRDKLDSATAQAQRLAFYGLDIFTAHEAAMTRDVMIDTPLTAGPDGTIYFGFVVTAKNPANLKSGIARLAPDGTGTWVGATAAAGDSSITQVVMNCAPALSADGTTLYIAVSNASAGYLLGLDTTTLATKYEIALTDPSSGQPAWIPDISSASPTIGPDGDVYYGVLENPFPSHNNRGWLLHYDATLATAKTPGSFGWDDTASIVPASLVTHYKAKGAYLLMTKYNNYEGIGTGDGENKIAILDPAATQQDEYSQTSVTVMKEAETILGPTPAPGGGVYEWCINSAAVDAFTGAVFAASEDGNLYRWDLARNKLTQHQSLTAPTDQGYTPNLVGPNGTVYAVNNATLFAIGK
ncbi:MAG TPA: hypothetical protein VMB71_01710 [Acetobacteraceae bacterium]|nr:hypothetical protein [Acetobacteraceae bacterium]